MTSTTRKNKKKSGEKIKAAAYGKLEGAHKANS